VISTYRRAWGLAAAMRSALAQTHADLELLVLDDASGGETEEVVRSFADARVVFHNQPTRQGMVGNWGTGVARAQGDFIVILADDDQLRPSFVANRLACFARHPDAIVAFSRYEERTPEGALTYGPWRAVVPTVSTGFSLPTQATRPLDPLARRNAPRPRPAPAGGTHHPQAAPPLLPLPPYPPRRPGAAGDPQRHRGRPRHHGGARSQHTHGSLANWHPHLHLVVTDGGFRPDGTFVRWPGWPAYDSAALSEAFRRAVLRLFVGRG
jgi:hypothetical protein